MDIWEILGIDDTQNIAEIKHAYAEQSKKYHPETHPEEWKILHTAYQQAMKLARGQQVAPIIHTDNISLATTKENVTAPILPDKVEIPVIPQETKESNKYDQFLEEVKKSPKKEMTNPELQSLITEFEDLLHDSTRYPYPSQWMNFITDSRFLKYQYHPKFIKEMTKNLENNRIDELQPRYAIIYLFIAYGCMVQELGVNVKSIEIVYKQELLHEMGHALYRSIRSCSEYCLIESREDLLAIRYSFYIYRCILWQLDMGIPDLNALIQLILDGFRPVNYSHLYDLLYSDTTDYGEFERYFDSMRRDPVFFDLMLHLVDRDGISQEFVDLLYAICKLNLVEKDYDSYELLKIILEEKAKNKNLYFPIFNAPLLTMPYQLWNERQKIPYELRDSSIPTGASSSEIKIFILVLSGGTIVYFLFYLLYSLLVSLL